MQWALEHVQGASPAFLSRSRVNGSVSERLLNEWTGGVTPVVEVPKGTPEAWMTSYMAMDRTEWRMGARFDLAALRARMQAMAQSGMALPR
ncbi:MAG: hypothetical protein R3E96_11945 [Planctomycetota bacterium]